MDKDTSPIDLYEAIDRMKKISHEGGSFSFSHRKWNRSTRRGGDLARVANARIRPKASDEEVANASYKLFYVDIDTGIARVCWQPLITEFDGRPTILN